MENENTWKIKMKWKKSLFSGLTDILPGTCESLPVETIDLFCEIKHTANDSTLITSSNHFLDWIVSDEKITLMIFGEIRLAECENGARFYVQTKESKCRVTIGNQKTKREIDEMSSFVQIAHLGYPCFGVTTRSIHNRFWIKLNLFSSIGLSERPNEPWASLCVFKAAFKRLETLPNTFPSGFDSIEPLLRHFWSVTRSLDYCFTIHSVLCECKMLRINTPSTAVDWRANVVMGVEYGQLSWYSSSRLAICVDSRWILIAVVFQSFGPSFEPRIKRASLRKPTETIVDIQIESEKTSIRFVRKIFSRRLFFISFCGIFIIFRVKLMNVWSKSHFFY